MEYKKIRPNTLPKRFVAIDFETMDSWRATICSVGIAVFENGVMKDTYYSLVCPPSKAENYHCYKIHGLHYRDVKDSPSFSDIWPMINEKYIKDSPLVTHNTSFESSCINAYGKAYGTLTDYEYIDTLDLSREILTWLPNHTLDTTCEAVKYKLKHHHNALEDAIACGEVYIRIKKLEGLLNE